MVADHPLPPPALPADFDIRDSSPRHLREMSPAETLAAKLARSGGHASLVDLTPAEFAVYLGRELRWVLRYKNTLPGYKIITRQCHVINLASFQQGQAQPARKGQRRQRQQQRQRDVASKL